MAKTTKSRSAQKTALTAPAAPAASHDAFTCQVGRDDYGCPTIALRRTAARPTGLDERRLRAALYALAARMELRSGERGETWAVCLDVLKERVWLETSANKQEQARACAFVDEVANSFGQ